MKNAHAKVQPQRCSLPGQTPAPAVEEQAAIDGRNRTMLVGLMVPLLMMILHGTMFTVALPTIRATFGVQADTTAWIVTAFALPVMVAMPLYGRLSDGLGKRRLFGGGIIIFLAGTAVTLLTSNLYVLIVGRAIQGIGAASVNPLCMAIISERFPVRKRGQALGTWNTSGPIAGLIGPLLGGFLVDYWGWRMVYWPVLLIGLGALFVIREQVPPTKRSFVQPGFLRTFDWGGVVLLSLAATMLIFYLSSRPITGVEPLQDWRLLAVTLVLFGGFIFWEKRQPDPFVNLSIFAQPGFSRASVGAGLRMLTMGGVGFLLPLYYSDIHGLNAVAIGGMEMIRAAALLMTMRLGGQLADRRQSSRWPVVMGSLVQVGAIGYLACLPETVWLGWVAVGLISHGLGAGLTLAPFHRTALNRVPTNQTGMAAGLYSMSRSGGVVLGVAVGGVILQYGLDHFAALIYAYQVVFWFITGIAFLGILIGWGLRE
ncbi:MAG: MFS transporter [Anaerolineae bacterium]|nr:MFS transporter [Anaerolineae bacterium]